MTDINFCENMFIDYISEVLAWVHESYQDTEKSYEWRHEDERKNKRTHWWQKWVKEKEAPSALDCDFFDYEFYNWTDLIKIYSRKPGNAFISFESFWQFAQFIRFAEKVSIYDNNQDRDIFVDSDLYSDTVHKLIVRIDNDIKIFIKLEKKIGLQYEGEIIPVIYIRVAHENGKKLTNEFTIVDDSPKCRDMTDSWLLNMLTDKLTIIFTQILEEIMNNIKDIYIQKRDIRRKIAWLESKVEDEES